MYFLIDLAKTIQSASDYEFSRYVESLAYFSSQNPILGQRWNEYFQENKKTFESPTSAWHQTIREIRTWEDQELDYMYQRIMKLSRDLIGKKIQYFTVETFSGKATIPDRIQILNRLVQLSNELLDKIYPSIIKLLNFKINDVEIISQNIPGVINWNKTIQYSLKNSGGQLLNFVSNMPIRSFNTPENVLFLLSVKLLQNDAKQLINFQKSEYGSLDDRKIIWDVASKTKKLLDEPFFREINRSSNISRIIGNSTPDLNKILHAVEKNLRVQKTTQNEYYNLVNWTRKYLDFNVNRYQNLANFSLINLKDVDTMFELWILFEFVIYMKKIHHAKIIPIIESSKENKLRGFKIITDKEFNLMYERRYWKVPIGQSGFEHDENMLKPDFTFEFGENCLCGHSESEHLKKRKKILECAHKDESTQAQCSCKIFRKYVPIVLDAKNWKNHNRMEAVQKIAWYLMNLNQWGAKIGILLFSNYDKKSEDEPRTDYWGPLEINHGKWEIMNFVVKASRKTKFDGQLYQVFDYILSQLHAQYENR